MNGFHSTQSTTLSSRDPTHRIPNLDVQVVLRLDFLLDVFVALFVLAVHPSLGVRSLRCDAGSKFTLRKTREKKTWGALIVCVNSM